MRELAADSGADLRHLLGPAQPIKSGHQRRVQARRDGQGGGRNRSNRPPGCALAFRLQGRLGHLLHEQGNAVATLDDVVPDVCWQQFVADDAINHCADIALCQPINRRGGYVWLSNPGWVEFRPECGVRILSTNRPNSSRLVGSVQCASSKIISTGLERVRVASCKMNASSVLCLRCCGASSSAG